MTACYLYVLLSFIFTVSHAQNMTTAMTTTTIATTTLEPLQPRNVQNCNITFGCFRLPKSCTGADCKLLITYSKTAGMENYIDFTMETTEKWVALGHDSAGRMDGAIGVTCYKPAGDPVMDSFQTTGPPTSNRGVSLAMNLSSGIQNLGIIYQDNRVLCKYRRKLNGSGSFMVDLNTNQFAIWAYGDQNNGPGGHNPNERGRTNAAVNLQFELQMTTPPPPTTTPSASGTIPFPQTFALFLSTIATLIHLYR